MRIAINGMFWTEPHVGSGQYLHNLLNNFSNQLHHRFVLVIPRYRTTRKPMVPHVQTVLMPTPFDNRSENIAKVWFEQIAFGQVCRKLRVDVAHVPYLGPSRFSPVPFIVTIHDLIPLLLPTHRDSALVRTYMQLAVSGARRANKIIADSEHTKQDVIEHLGIPGNQIVVTHLAAARELSPQSSENIATVRDRFRLIEPYILYIGGFQAHKNVEAALRAFAKARPTFSRRVVFAIGGRLPTATSALFPDIHSVILEEGIADDVALLGPVTDAEKAALMSGCEAFVFPSRYEGFGLPPLEAMQCGAPVLASSTTSVGEIVADGGVLLPPDDIDAWAQAIIQVVNNSDWQAELRRRGLQQAARFDWKTTAQQTLDVYQQFAARRSTVSSTS